MDPQYQQMMVQQLMGAGYLPQGMGGQNASTPYGQSFMSGNQMQIPQQSSSTGLQALWGPQNQNAASQVMQQPMATYS